MCTEMTSSDCEAHCVATFCATSQAYTAALMETEVEGQSWTSWLVGNLFVVSCVAGVAYWAKQRLTKKMPKRIRRRINEVETYYKL
jgi:hypothetical protein